MEIHIIQKGERIGPLSETQVRQYLDDGLASPHDLAMYDGMEDWLPLELVLAHLPPFTPTPEISSSGEAAEQMTASTQAALEQDETPFIRPNALSESTPEEPMPSLTASQKTKRKLSKIVIQPILPLETTLPLQRKTRSGKTAVTLEPMRSTISLPPVTGHVPREKKSAKSLIRTGQLSFGDFSEKPAPVAEPVPVATAVVPPALPSVAAVAPPATPPSLPVPATPALLPAPSPLASDIRRKPVAWWQRLPPWTLYLGLALALLIVCLIAIFIYLTATQDEAGSSINSAAVPSVAPAPNPVAAETPPAAPVTAAEFSERGLIKQSKGDVDGAIADYTQAVTLNPKAVEVFYQRGQARQATGDMAGAIADYTQVISLNPKRANAFSNRGYIKQRQGDADGALADYAEALAIDPKSSAAADAYYNMGLLKVQRGDLDGAIAAYDSAIDVNPKMAFAYYNRGVAKNTEGEVDGAVADYTQALLLNPNIARAYCDRGVARQAKGDTDGALDDYNHALVLDPKMGDAYYNRGLIREQRGDLDGAIDDNAQVIALDPKYAQAYNRRGLALFGKGKLDDALADFKQFCALDPRDAGADTARLYIWVITTHEDPSSDPDSALSTSLLNDWNSTPEDLTSKIGAFLVGHIDENELIANAASPDPSREPPQLCRVWYFAGMKRLLAGDITTAASDFQKSVATAQKDLCEFTFAQGELQAINKSTEVAAKPDSSP